MSSQRNSVISALKSLYSNANDYKYFAFKPNCLCWHIFPFLFLSFYFCIFLFFFCYSSSMAPMILRLQTYLSLLVQFFNFSKKYFVPSFVLFVHYFCCFTIMTYFRYVKSSICIRILVIVSI